MMGISFPFYLLPAARTAQICVIRTALEATVDALERQVLRICFECKAQVCGLGHDFWPESSLQ